ncbi:hypothetical protein QTP86_012593 [Hemibagrus guttatus]|nr:hypothetical protein QTP86_012593 [Hemibagrus guttatus]
MGLIIHGEPGLLAMSTGMSCGACGGNLTQSLGEFLSPHYPSNYQNNARCTWTLLAGERQVVSLNFTFVDMESCCDFIHVYNGPTAQHSLLGSVTGNQIASFNSSSRYMTVVFSTDGSVTGRGFRAQWSFKFAAQYSCRYNCGYNFGSCSCSSSCQYYGNCCSDYYDYCTYTSVAPTPGGACGGNLTQSQGEFFSPHYPSNYQNNARCTWTLLAGELQVVSLNFTFVDMESCCDFIRVYNGPTAQHSLLGSVTGNQIASFNSSSRYMTVVFSTDGSVTGRGFRAQWSFKSAQYSCLYNCGYNFGSCSCNGSCQYYRNCCHDYYGGACGGNLTQSLGEFFSPHYPSNYQNNARCTWTLLAGELQVVSLNFTFVDMESCCDFIRVYNGPTAQHSLLGSVTGNQIASFNSSSRYMTVVFSTDGSVTGRGFRAQWSFKYYCSYETSAPVPACGGSYYSSGFISSPYYPGYYHDNAYCLWQLWAPTGQTIFLSFQDFDLDHCCNCDYVNVYDGPSTGSHLLGKLCHNDTNHLDFQSSSSFLTVLFRSDYSGVGRGFKAYFSSSLNHNTGRVDCSSDWMNIAIQKSYLDSLGFNWHDLYLDDHRCRPSTDYTYVTFNFSLNSCSTRKRTQNGRIIYTNNVRAAQSTSGEITRHNGRFLIFVSCMMERDSSVGTLYEAKEISNANITGTGRFNTTMSFYPSSSFSYPITESPYRVDLNQQLYVQVQLTRADPSLHLFLDTCVTSPNNNFNIRNYDLIRNGCGRDSTVYIYKNGDRYFAQFSFRAFMFLRTHNQVFLRCDVIICTDNDYGSRCRQGCHNRKKRSSSSDHPTEVLTLGPITLKDIVTEIITILLFTTVVCDPQQLHNKINTNIEY